MSDPRDDDLPEDLIFLVRVHPNEVGVEPARRAFAVNSPRLEKLSKSKNSSSSSQCTVFDG
jgi:hypothetical protein